MAELYLAPAVVAERRTLPDGSEGLLWAPHGWDQGVSLLAARQVKDHPAGFFLAYYAARLPDETGCFRFTLPLSGTVPGNLRNYVRDNLGHNIPNGWQMRQCVRYVVRTFGWVPPDGVIQLGDQAFGPEDD